MASLKIKKSKLRIADHLRELRNRIIVWALAFISSSGVGYFLYQPILRWLTVPLKSPLFYSSPIGALQTVFNVALLFGFIVSLPVLLFEVIQFLEPVTDRRLTNLGVYIIISFFLAAAGIVTAYYLVLPATFRFLANFAGNQLNALISTRDYFPFITKYLFGFALLFQLPLIVFILGRFTELSPELLLKYLRHVIVVSFILAAILTPTPDPINQTIMAAPIIILYLISIGALAIGKKIF